MEGSASKKVRQLGYFHQISKPLEIYTFNNLYICTIV